MGFLKNQGSMEAGFKMNTLLLYVLLSVIVVFGLEVFISNDNLLLFLGGGIFGLLLFIANQISKK
jgi:hypothetical protein